MSALGGANGNDDFPELAISYDTEAPAPGSTAGGKKGTRKSFSQSTTGSEASSIDQLIKMRLKGKPLASDKYSDFSFEIGIEWLKGNNP